MVRAAPVRPRGDVPGGSTVSEERFAMELTAESIGIERAGRRPTWLAVLRWVLGLTAMAVLGYVYYRGASYNAQVVNPKSHPGDQSSYMEYARDIYRNRHGADVMGDRNRMPGFPWVMSYFYDPAKSESIVKGYRKTYDAEGDDEFFARGKRVNIWLSMGILAAMFFIVRWQVGTLAASSMTLVLAFGAFVFKAGYFQAELLFYFTFFLSFLLLCQLLKRPRWWLGILAGVATALAHLVKAAMLPLLGLFVTAYLGRELVVLIGCLRKRNRSTPAGRPAWYWRMATLLITLACFVATLWPYLRNSKEQFGYYFYNVNSTFYAWYEKWRDVSNRVTGTKAHGDRLHWPDMPADRLPSAARYWREHTAGQIGERVSKGLDDIVRESYGHYWYAKYVCLYLLLAVVLAACRPKSFGRWVRSRWNWAVLGFVVIYLVTYVLLTAFYAPISLTGTTRFLLAHLAPLLFAISFFSIREPFVSTGFTVGPARVTARHFHVAVIVMMLADIPFAVWPRLMDASKFGGF